MMVTKINLLTVSALVAITVAMPQKIHAMEKEEKVNGGFFRMNPGIIDPNEKPTSNPERRFASVDPYENNNQHTANEEKNTNATIVHMELEDNRAWEYAKWIGNGIVQVSYVCAMSASDLIKFAKIMIPPETTWEKITRTIYGPTKRTEILEFFVDKVNAVKFVSDAILYVYANALLMDK
jgi:hypothetical protein